MMIEAEDVSDQGCEAAAAGADDARVISQEAQNAADRGSRIKQIGRWHDLAGGRGVVICESDSAEAVPNWALNWNSILEVDVVPVLDDNETRALGKSRETSS